MFGILKIVSAIGNFVFGSKQDHSSNKKDENKDLKNGNNFSLINNMYNIMKLAKTFTNSESLEDAMKKLKGNSKKEKEFLLQLEQKEIEGICKDNISARERDQFIHKKTGSNFRANLMLFFICFLLIACIVALIFFRRNLASDVVAIISGITGALSQCIRDVFHFEFGSSHKKNNNND